MVKFHEPDELTLSQPRAGLTRHSEWQGIASSRVQPRKHWTTTMKLKTDAQKKPPLNKERRPS